MNVLAIGCHPDDVEIACAGTLAKCVKRGDKVIVAHLCNGSLGHVIIKPPELIPMRAQEARDAGKLAGIEVLDGVFDDLDIYSDNAESRNKVVEVIQYAQPDFIITHNPDDYMPDHTATAKLVFDASFTATLPNWPSKTKKAAKLVPNYYMDTLAGVNFVPTEYVDISDVIETKIEMLECHESQLKWMRDHDHIDFADFVRTCSKYRGLQCGVDYAEGFTQAAVWPRMKPYRLLP
jgi:LmbE family N-acetylglucosaminyl deacetylase